MALGERLRDLAARAGDPVPVGCGDERRAIAPATPSDANLYAAARTPFGRFNGAWPGCGPTISPPSR
ncbi:hypothetical protein GCM10018966_049270 [Streptomyces yanii]